MQLLGETNPNQQNNNDNNSNINNINNDNNNNNNSNNNNNNNNNNNIIKGGKILRIRLCLALTQEIHIYLCK